MMVKKFRVWDVASRKYLRSYADQGEEFYYERRYTPAT